VFILQNEPASDGGASRRIPPGATNDSYGISIEIAPSLKKRLALVRDGAGRGVEEVSRRTVSLEGSSGEVRSPESPRVTRDRSRRPAAKSPRSMFPVGESVPARIEFDAGRLGDPASGRQHGEGQVRFPPPAQVLRAPDFDDFPKGRPCFPPNVPPTFFVWQWAVVLPARVCEQEVCRSYRGIYGRRRPGRLAAGAGP
jgi:hypothetical protein